MQNANAIKKELSTMKLSFKQGSYYIDNIRCDINIIAFKVNEKNSKLSISDSDITEFGSLVKTVIDEKKKRRDYAINHASTYDQKIKLNGKATGEFYPHEQRHKISNKLDVNLLKLFYWAKDPSGEGTSIFIKSPNNEHKYTKIILSNSVTTNDTILKSALSRISHTDDLSLAGYYMQVWETMLSNIANKIRGQFSNLNSQDTTRNQEGSDNIFKIISSQMPAIALNNMLKIEYYTVASDDGISYTDVTIRRRGDSPKQPTVFEYLLLALAILPTLSDKEIEWPEIYTSEENVDALNHFNLKSFIQPCTYDDVPAWNEFGLKYTDSEWKVFKAFIYSVFESKNKGRQCLYQYDNGFSAKSVLQSVLVHYMGETNVAGLQKDSLTNQFGMSKIWDKRLIIVGDNKNKRIIHTEKIHMLLGGDYCDVEHKGRNSFSAKLASKLIINGNVTPYIDANATHERTRLIILKPKMNQKVLEKLAAKDETGKIIIDGFGNPQLLGDPTFYGKLINEFPKFLYLCKLVYDELCPNHGNIKLPPDMIDALYDLGEEDEALYDKFIDDKLDICDEGKCKKGELLQIWKLEAKVYGLENTTNAYSNFINYVKNAYSIYECRLPKTEGRAHAYNGMQLKHRNVTEMQKNGIKTPASLLPVVDGESF